VLTKDITAVRFVFLFGSLNICSFSCSGDAKTISRELLHKELTRDFHLKNSR
jgi:hypothetical protein